MIKRERREERGMEIGNREEERIMEERKGQREN